MKVKVKVSGSSNKGPSIAALFRALILVPALLVAVGHEEIKNTITPLSFSLR